MLIRDCFEHSGEYVALREDLRAALGARSLPFLATGLCESAADGLMVSLLSSLPQTAPALILLPDEKACVRLVELLREHGLRAAYYTQRDLNFYNVTASHEYEHDRIRVLFSLCSGELDAVIATPDAALGFTIPRAALTTHTVSLFSDTLIDPAALAARLVAAGYVRVELVEGAGQFAWRGGILDIYAPCVRYFDENGILQSAAAPLRIELFGDEIDRMGLFDVQTQRLVTPITGCEIPPAREVLASADVRAAIRREVDTLRRRCTDERAAEELNAELAAIDGGEELRFIDKYLLLAHGERETLLSYLPDAPFVLLRGTNALRERVRAALGLRDTEVKELIENGTVSGPFAEYGATEAALSAFLERGVTVHLDSIAEGLSGRRLAGLYTFRTKHTVCYADRFDLLLEDLSQYKEAGRRILLTAPGEPLARELAEKLTAQGMPPLLGTEQALTLPPQGEVLLQWREHAFCFELPTAGTVYLSLDGDAQALRRAGTQRARRGTSGRSGKRAILSFADLKQGDLVVHEAHGIGRYEGLETLTIDGVTRDYIKIRYAGTDELFLPCDRLESVSKYIGAHADDGLVKLSRFGGADWKKAKARARAAVADMAKDLIRLYAERARRPGFAFPADDAYQLDFEAAFGFEETEGQLAAAADIKNDMMCATPMDRLLCGDVGYGKTEVALRAAYKAVLAGKQVAILVPTTILALQHYQTIESRMRAFAVRTDMLSRFRTKKQQEETLRRLARGDIDVIVGTHRLIGSDVRFKDLGLLIVDEEQRFGVAQKERIKQLCGNVDVLTLTATPIPRTLNMAMSGIRDISVLDEAPGDRLPVQTYVLEHDELILTEAIRRELRRGGQVFYLHNSVDTIYSLAATLKRELGDVRVVAAHGGMQKEELEQIWGDMLTGEIDVLVSTTIIETGIDVPNANTLIVDNAHRLGLSQLHQLRGRVGRSPRRAYAYFTYPRTAALTDIQRKRLEAIREYAEFGAGFRIALRDLELRGAGNILGAQQHGHLDAVGYELYVKLLEHAVLAERGEAPVERPECVVTLAVDACLPEKYVRASAQRISLYKRISLIETPYDLSDMTDELIDRYGEPPLPARNLLQIALVRSLAAAAGATQVRQDGATVHIAIPEPDTECWMRLADTGQYALRMLLSATPAIQYRLKDKRKAPEELVALLLAYKERSEQKGSKS